MLIVKPHHAAAIAWLAGTAAASAADEPVVFALEEPGYTARATLDPRLADDPEIFAILQQDAERMLPQGRTIAEGNAERYIVDWTVVTTAPETISVRREEYIYNAGAAHSEAFAAGEIWLRSENRPIEVEALFDPAQREAAISAINRALASDLEAQKAGRGLRDGVAQQVRDQTELRSAATLAPSTQAGHAGGLTFWGGSYSWGAYVEGGYALSVPQSVFRHFLAEPYRAWFAGDPTAPDGPARRIVCDSPAVAGCDETE